MLSELRTLAPEEVTPDSVLEVMTNCGNGASCVEIMRWLPSGTFVLGGFDQSIVVWDRMHERVGQAIMDLVRANRIAMVPTSALVYLYDGERLNLPIAKRARPYKKPHWLPVVFNSPQFMAEVARYAKKGAHGARRR